jgi:hypothetical protein
MKNYFLFRILFFVAFAITACSDAGNNNNGDCDIDSPFGKDPIGFLKRISTCKLSGGVIQVNVTLKDECIFYKYHQVERILWISHLNSGMNCDPGEVSVRFNIKDDVINAIEKQQKAGAKCECLYDVDYEIRNIYPGQYLINISGPIIDGVNYPSFGCYIDLNKKLEDTICIERGFYPWLQ